MQPGDLILEVNEKSTALDGFARLLPSDPRLPVKLRLQREVVSVDEEWEVDDIHGERVHDGERTYLVKWAGYDLEASTWEPATALAECEALTRWELANAQREPQREASAIVHGGGGGGGGERHHCSHVACVLDSEGAPEYDVSPDASPDASPPASEVARGSHACAPLAAPEETPRPVPSRPPPPPPRHFNATLGAHNVWEIALPEALLAEAAAIFDRCELAQRFQELRDHPTRRYGALRPPDGAADGRPAERFFAVRAGRVADGAPGWRSDVHWISADDEATHRTFERLFESCGLAERFGGLVEHRRKLQLYCASYVVRMRCDEPNFHPAPCATCTLHPAPCTLHPAPCTLHLPTLLARQVRTRCDEPNFHYDFVAGAGTNALTLLAPLQDYGRAKGFHLLYEEATDARESAEADGDAAEAEGGRASKAAKTTAGEGRMAGGSAGEGTMTMAVAAAAPIPLLTPATTVAARWCPPAAATGSRPQPLSVSRARRTAKSTRTPQRLVPTDAHAGKRIRPEAIEAAGFGHEPFVPRGATRRYEYARGKAIVFGSGFRHSTEPGRAAAGASPHAYLCFTFGTDLPEHWPHIAQTVDGDQSRVIAPPGGDGAVALSRLGRRLHEEASDAVRERGAAKSSRP